MYSYEVFEKLLKQRGLKAIMVAQNTNISAPAFTGWKQGKYELKREKLEKLAEYFDVPVSIFYEKTEKEPYTKQEVELLYAYNSMNEEGKNALLLYAEFLRNQAQYSKKSSTYLSEEYEAI